MKYTTNKKILSSFYNSYNIPIAIFDKEYNLLEMYSDFGTKLTELYLRDSISVVKKYSEAEPIKVISEDNLIWMLVTFEHEYMLFGPVLTGLKIDFAYESIPEYAEEMFIRICRNLCGIILDEEHNLNTILIKDNSSVSNAPHKDAFESTQSDIYNLTMSFMHHIRSGDTQSIKDILQSRDFTNMFENLSGDISMVRTAYTYMNVTCYFISMTGGLSYTSALSLLNKYSEQLNNYSSHHSYSAACMRLVYDYTNAVRKEKLNTNCSEAVRRALMYIDENIYTSVSLDELSVLTGYSSSAFRHKFKNEMGISITEYIKRKKIDKSCYFLKNTSISCTEISVKLGYCSQSYFIRQFKEVMGVTPNEYRSGACNI